MSTRIAGLALMAGTFDSGAALPTGLVKEALPIEGTMFEYILTALDGSPHDTKTLAATKELHS